MSYKMVFTNRTSRKDSSRASQKGTLLRGSRTYFGAMLRSLGLQIIKHFGSWRGSEEPKIAIRQSRTVATARASIHFVPVVACLVLLAYNAIVVFVPYNPGYTALQFVAKLHEILMQASIAAIVLGYVRHQLVRDTPLPFGALLAGSHIYSPSYLISLEFWGTVTAPLLRTRLRMAYFVLVSFGVLLASTVGPSSATLMLPRRMQPRVGASDSFINETELFPAQLTGSNLGLVNLAAVEQLFYQDLDQFPTVGATWDIDERVNISFIVSVSDEIPEYTVCSPSIASAIIRNEIPAHNQAELQKRLANSTGHSLKYISKQPCVKVHCTLHKVYGEQNDSHLQLLPEQSSDLGMTEGDFLNSYNASGDPHLIWLPPPESFQNNYSVVAVYAPHHNGTGRNSAWTCSLKAAWRSSRIETRVDSHLPTYTSGKLTDPNVVQHTDYEPEFIDPSNEAWPEAVVSIDPDWATLSVAGNYSIPGLTSAVTLQNLLRHLDFLADSRAERGDSCHPWNECHGYHLTAMLGTMVTTAMSLLTTTLTADQQLGGEEPDLTRVRVEVFGIGTGYSIATVTDILATVVLSLYCFFALAFITWSLWTGESSNSWDSTAELVALGLNSKVPTQTEHTSAGIETIAIFRQPIRILENKEQSLEIVFGGEKLLEGTHRRMRRNQAY